MESIFLQPLQDSGHLFKESSSFKKNIAALDYCCSIAVLYVVFDLQSKAELGDSPGIKTASTLNQEMVCKRAMEKWDDLDVYLPSVRSCLQSKVNNYKFFREFSFTFFSLFSINSFFKIMFLFLQNELAMWIPVGDFGFFLEIILRKHRDRKFRGLSRVREKWEASGRYIQ